MRDALHFQGWPLKEAFERTADPVLLDSWNAADRDWSAAGATTGSRFLDERIHGDEAVTHNARERNAWDLHEKRAKVSDVLGLEFKRLLMTGLLVSSGSRESPTAEPILLRSMAWSALAVSDWENSIIEEMNPARTPIFNVRVFPLIHSPNVVDLALNLTLDQAFKMFVLEDPEVKSCLRRLAQLSDSYEPILMEGRAPGSSGYGWQLHVTTSELTRVLEQCAHFTSDNPSIRPTIDRAATVLADRLNSLGRLLSSGDVPVCGTDTNTNALSKMEPSVFTRRQVWIDSRSGCVLDHFGQNPVIRWTGVLLAQIENAKSGGSEAEPREESNGLQAEEDCYSWLVKEMRSRPERRPKPKGDFFGIAKGKFTCLSQRGFDRAWRRAVQETGSNWAKAGAPEKSSH